MKIHDQVAATFFQNNPDLVTWVNSQLPSEPITCLGDGHDGVWNLFNQIGTIEQRREVLDWYQGNRKSTSSRGFAQTTQESAQTNCGKDQQ